MAKRTHSEKAEPPAKPPYDNPDLRILALADANLLPADVQERFDHWRIWRARDAIIHTVRKRLAAKIEIPVMRVLDLYVERLEEAEDEKTIFQGIYALSEVVEVYRQQLGIHSQYLILIMAGQLNPWGLLDFNKDFEQPAHSVIAAANMLWTLALENDTNVEALLAQLEPDDTYRALEAFYQSL